MKNIINWKVFFILWIASILATIAVLPYALGMQSSVLQNPNLPPLPVLIGAAILQTAGMFAIAIFGGMFFASRVGLDTPILDAATRGESVTDRIRAILPLSIILGVI